MRGKTENNRRFSATILSIQWQFYSFNSLFVLHGPFKKTNAMTMIIQLMLFGLVPLKVN